MPVISRRSVIGAAAAVLLACGGAHAAEPASAGRPLVFGLITPRAAQETRDNWAPFVQALAQAVHQPIEIRTYPVAGELVAAFRSGEVALAWMGNAPAVDVVESGSGAVFAQMITREGGFGYHSVLVVPASSPLQSLADVLARPHALRFGDGDLSSTSGHLVPLYFAFEKSGVNDIDTAFKSVLHSNHQKNLTMAARGEVDVATANNEELAFFARDFPALARQVRVIWQSPVIPQSPMLWRTALPAELRHRVLQFVVDYGKTAEERAVLDRMNRLSGFRRSNNRQLVPVADLEMFKARQAINNDASLSAEERARRIDEVIRRGSRLDLMLKLSAGWAR